MKEGLGLGYCGLVCGLCSDNKDCVGCKAGGCPQKDTCKNYQCCTRLGYEYCYQCPDFPCEDSILHKLRIRTFCKFIEAYGEAKLLACLKENEAKGIVYHYPKSHLGDYDLDNEEAIYEMILTGKIKKPL